MTTPRQHSTTTAVPMVSSIAVGYSRQSRTRLADIEAGRIISPEMQTDAAKSYALARGWQWDDELTRAAIETNTSGGQSKGDKKKGESSWKKRRGLGLLLEAAQQGRFAHLIVYKLSRLARSAREGLEICDAFERAGVAIHSASEGIDYSTATGRMIRTMMLAVAEMELENIREFAVEAMYSRAKSGKPHGPWPAWVGRDAKGEFVLTPPLAAAYRRLIELRIAGESYVSITRTLNAEGRPTGRGVLWSASLVATALNERTRQRYRGHSSYQSSDTREELSLLGVFPPLISEAESLELDAAMRTLAVGFPTGFAQVGNRRGVGSSYSLVEIAYCAVCGGKMVGRSGAKVDGMPTRSYMCRSAAEVPGAHQETSRGRRLMLLAEMLESAAVLGLATAYQRVLASEAPEDAKVSPGAQAVAPPRAPARSLEALEAAEKRLWVAYEGGAMTVAALRTRLGALESEREVWLAWQESELRRQDATLGWGLVSQAHTLRAAELRLLFRRLIARVEAPVIFPGVRIDRHNPHPARWVRIDLTEPLPGGCQSVLVALHPPRWSGPVHVYLCSAREEIPSPPPYYPPSQTYAAKVARRNKVPHA